MLSITFCLISINITSNCDFKIIDLIMKITFTILYYKNAKLYIQNSIFSCDTSNINNQKYFDQNYLIFFSVSIRDKNTIIPYQDIEWLSMVIFISQQKLRTFEWIYNIISANIKFRRPPYYSSIAYSIFFDFCSEKLYKQFCNIFMVLAIYE